MQNQFDLLLLCHKFFGLELIRMIMFSSLCFIFLWTNYSHSCVLPCETLKKILSNICERDFDRHLIQSTIFMGKTRKEYTFCVSMSLTSIAKILFNQTLAAPPPQTPANCNRKETKFEVYDSGLRSLFSDRLSTYKRNFSCVNLVCFFFLMIFQLQLTWVLSFMGFFSVGLILFIWLNQIIMRTVAFYGRTSRNTYYKALHNQSTKTIY